VFGYDAASQLIRAQTTNAATMDEVTSERFGYVYDASQNLRWRTNNTTVTGFTNNVLNQLTALNAIARDHDRRGNLLSNVQAGETLLYSWDDESQLISVRMDPASTPAFQPWRIDFVYDGLRRLRRALQFTWNGSAWTSQGETRYLYDGMLILQERNAGHTPQVTYTRGLDLSGTIEGAGGIGGLLMRSHGYSSGNWSTHNAYHSDANGNVTALMNSSGVSQASYKYNPYGGLISSSGTLAGANTMRFSSKPAIFSTTGSWGFYYYGYRFYDPANQRWLNRDPLEEEGGIGLYEVAGNNPVGLIDPFGLALAGPGGYLGGFSGPYNTFWSRNGGGIAGLVGTAIGYAAGKYMEGCPKPSKGCQKSRKECESCCARGAAAGAAGVVVVGLAGCVGTGGFGCALSAVGAAFGAKQVYDSYQACMLSCASLGASASGVQLN
jgi:RHS repeat-associated protein